MFENQIYSFLSNSSAECNQIYKFIQITSIILEREMLIQINQYNCQKHFTYLFHPTFVCLDYSQYKGMDHANGINNYLKLIQGCLDIVSYIYIKTSSRFLSIPLKIYDLY